MESCYLENRESDERNIKVDLCAAVVRIKDRWIWILSSDCAELSS